ncbi:hypothetical protein [Bradyrhizobium sp. CCBAU 25338]|uniref:hypothetical protein n=1 Tax=Bradyrhizobium sp. CCBAU 25338 TaxID=1641877 RepID=UPI002302F957|nr:hypothetical protein [Bradyrhizobium sp. CCBAU 25338]
MMTRRVTDTEIAARIVPTMLRWPADAKTIAWDRLRECVDALRGLVYTVNVQCSEAEQDGDLSPEGIIRRRTKIGQKALSELAEFEPLQLAAKAVAANLTALEDRMVELPKPTTNAVDFMLEQEIRSYVADQNSPVEFVLKAMPDRRVLSAVLTAPAFLSGLSDNEWNLVRERARAALHPQQSEMQHWLNKALSEVREGAAAAKRMLLERCELREDSEGQFRPIRSAKVA